MSEKPPKDSKSAFERALTEAQEARYVLRLYVAGNSSRSAAAIASIHNICEEHLKGRYQLEVIDVYQQPSMLKEEQIIATPTLIKYLPVPLRKLVGDLSESERILVGLNIIPLDKADDSE